MMKIYMVLLLIGLFLVGCGEKQTDQSSSSTPSTATSDSGMKVSHISDTLTYYLGLIKSVADAPKIPEEEVMSIQKAHLTNISRLADLGLITLAGPFWQADNKHVIRGLFVYKVESKAVADTLAATDPAVMAGRLKVENYAWVGSAKMAYDDIEGAEGMRGYFATIFWRNDTKITPPSFDQLYNQQAADLAKLSDSGRVVMAGPFINCRRGGQPYAMFIYSADSLSRIEKIVAEAPGMADSSLTAWTVDWYGPVGLRE